MSNRPQILVSSSINHEESNKKGFRTIWTLCASRMRNEVFTYLGLLLRIIITNCACGRRRRTKFYKAHGAARHISARAHFARENIFFKYLSSSYEVFCVNI